ncbi:MAG: hypothetical protein K9G11_01345 [Rickettsiaceae bacterium]|nr:hypothetical protein [Rickettsiaceae bacterium]
MFILDCHAPQARNDSITLPLEDVATSFILESLECLESHALASSRSLPWQRRYTKIMFCSSLGLIIR